MKKYIGEFLRRGTVAWGFGPLVLAIFYLVLKEQANVEILTVDQVCIGIFSLSALAFIAGGMNVVYQIERLPLMVAILIHGSTLYISYLVTYLINDWLEWGIAPILVFSVIFVGGYSSAGGSSVGGSSFGGSSFGGSSVGGSSAGAVWGAFWRARRASSSAMRAAVSFAFFLSAFLSRR